MAKRKSGEINVITAEGQEVYFDLREFINRWRAGFRILGLPQMEEALERKMTLSDTGLADMEKWTEQGYNFAILFPPNPWQYLEDIVSATAGPLRGLAAVQQ